jgi:ribonuclease J
MEGYFMTKLRFYGGIGVIGGTKIVLEQEGWRILLDMGLDIPEAGDLLRTPVVPRPGHELQDMLKLGIAPMISHVYKAEALTGMTDMKLSGGTDGHTALFLSHAHMDHIGLAGWVDEQIPIYAAEETVRLMDALEAAGEGLRGGAARVQNLPAAQPLQFGPFRVTRYDVDHDVEGASAYAIETAAGVVAYTGDFRLHGRHPEKIRSFAQAVHGARLLITEGTTLASDFRFTVRTEAQVDAAFAQAFAELPGLLLTTLYPRNLERIAALLALAHGANREFVWPPAMAKLFRNWGFEHIKSWGEDVQTADIAQNPGHYVLQLSLSHLPELLDLPAGPGTVFLHANGEPLGTFDPRYSLLQDWLNMRRIPFWQVGTGGHAYPDDIHRLVEWVAPEIVMPIHSPAPERLIPPPGTRRWMPQRGVSEYNVMQR